MKNFLKAVLKYIIIFAIAFVGSIILVTYVKEKTFGFNIRYLGSTTSILIMVLAVGGTFVYDMLRILDGKGKKNDTGKAEDKVKDAKGRETTQFFNRDFLTDEDLKKIEGFNYNTLSSIQNSKKDGILIRAEEKHNKMEINFVTPIHTLVVGTTSSGKTSRFVVPSLQLMSMTAAKPSFVITDPKGELYDKCCNKFIEEGYDVKIINLRDPFSSVQWNPLSYPYDMYQRSYHLEKEVKVHPPGDNPKQYNLIIQRPFDYNTTTWFEFNNFAYADKD